MDKDRYGRSGHRDELRPVMHRGAVVFIGATLLLAGHAPTWAGGLAFDLTGTWAGTTTCNSLFEGEKIKIKQAPSIHITQNGSAIGMRADYGGGFVDSYTGLASPDGKTPERKGQVVMIACGTDSIAGNQPDFDEVARFSVTAPPSKVRATFKGLSFFSDPGVVSPEAGTCMWTFTRVDTRSAGIATECAATLEPLPNGRSRAESQLTRRHSTKRAYSASPSD